MHTGGTRNRRRAPWIAPEFFKCTRAHSLPPAESLPASPATLPRACHLGGQQRPTPKVASASRGRGPKLAFGSLYPEGPSPPPGTRRARKPAPPPRARAGPHTHRARAPTRARTRHTARVQSLPRRCRAAAPPLPPRCRPAAAVPPRAVARPYVALEPAAIEPACTPSAAALTLLPCCCLRAASSLRTSRNLRRLSQSVLIDATRCTSVLFHARKI